MAGGLVLFAAALHVATREVLVLAAVGIAASTIDDGVIDLIYLSIWLRRRALRMRPVPAANLPSGSSWMAIMVPAWDEAAVIASMLRSLTTRLDYPKYRVFVGVYPNDPATLAAVRTVVDHRISPVICTRPGSTTKADCLNHIWRAVIAHEAEASIRFKAIVFHDAEDVVDRHELRVFDHLIPGLAMVQLPVIPLVDPGSRWISGHYLDEFAESHGKDIIVRGALGAAVPSAGVACAIDRDVLAMIAGGTGTPFDPACMTEDYELGMKVAALGHRGALVRIPGFAGGRTVATHEHFPATFETAVKQKTRWLLGIALSGWDRIGWQGGIADRYMLLRDRKSIVAPLLTIFGYVAVAMVLVDAEVSTVVPAALRFDPLVAAQSPLAALLWLNTIALGWRLGLRASFTAATHGWREGLRAVPRTIVGNAINAVAATSALRRYARIRAGHESPAWDKTTHKFTVPAE
ncbi:glycosyl transferase family protein [Polymorphobacter megasporae]|uniref:glycosyl transferase family protein n=1 Tax=Glacieibacterium megasporae TaxID=2835787 RepID=UPI001C1DDCD6|nr:glycosyl transferase family protein [Polymorphobacter megasporae]UAJ10343.1 glycosyl transferase family protein [Polymorphobacter megasporae]